MQVPELPEDELHRVGAPHERSLLDTAPDERFDRFTRLARHLFGVPIALLSFIDGERQCFNSNVELDIDETGWEASFCSHTSLSGEIVEVQDIRCDPRFVDNPLVTGPPNIRFYAGASFSTHGGRQLGALCILDDQPRQLTAEQRQALRDLADCIEEELVVLREQQLQTRLQSSESRFGAVIQALPDIVQVLDREGRVVDCNEHPDLLLPRAKVVGKLIGEVLPVDLAEQFMSALNLTFTSGEQVQIEYSLDLPSGLGHFQARLQKLDDVEVLITIRNIDDEKAAAYELEVERDFAVSLISMAPVIVLLLDIEGVIQHVNPYFEQLSGYSCDEVKGKVWFTMFLADVDRSLIRVTFHRALYHVPTRGVVHSIVTRDGELREIEWYSQPVLNTAGEVTGLLAVGQDVTERNQQEERTRLSEVRLNRAQSIAKVGSWQLDLHTGELDWTDEIYHLFELEKSNFDATYEAFLAAIHPDDRGIVDAAYSQSLEDHTPYFVTHRLLFPDGRIKWVEERCSTDFDANGTALISRGTVQDISERREIEDDLQLKNVAIATSIDAIVIVAVTGEIVYANPAFLSMWRFDDLDSLATSTPKDLWIYPTDSESDGEASRSLISGTAWTGQAIAIRKDGSRFPVRLSSAGIRDKHDTMTHLMASFVDITELIQTERLRNEFVSTVSHELRTPLTSISGGLGLLVGGALGELPERAQQIIDIAYKNSQNLSLLVDDLLDIEKITTGRMHFDMQPQALKPLVVQAIEATRGYRVDRRVTLALAGDVPEVEVLVDSHRLMQVLSNLLSNAVKFSPENGVVEITVELRGRLARVTVTDHGPGVPELFRDRIFEKFAQADGSDTRPLGGTGLGLAISRELLAHMGGRIDFESVEGEGASFYIELASWSV